MDDFLFVGTTQSNSKVYVSGLSAETLRENGLSQGAGLFLYEEVDDAASGGIRVLASVTDMGAAYRLLDFLRVDRACAA